MSAVEYRDRNGHNFNEEEAIKMNNKDIPSKILDNAISSDLTSTGMDIAEIGLDRFLDDSFLKEIPCIKTIFGIAKGVINIRDKIFMAKVAKFLLSLRNISEEDRKSFQNKISEDYKFKRELGDSLVLLLDRLNDLEKPEILATIFTYFLKGKIDYGEFRRLGTAIEMAFIDDLKKLIFPPGAYDSNHLLNLVHTGLIAFEGGKTWNDVGAIQFKLSYLGQLYVKIMTGTL
jgi:hypothetical protein